MEHVFCSYYTKSEHITNYMCEMLDLDEGHVVLEPSAGDGVFIDKIKEQFPDISIDALDLNAKAVEILKAKYRNSPNIVARNTDTLFDEILDDYAIKGGHYDRIIGNPPYGGWLDYDTRADLKEKYSGHYAKETYSLFLLRCVSLLKNGGKLSFIIPDTFLFLHRHIRLRELLLTGTKIIEILIFPSNVFPNVQFGYSNLSIITIQRENNSDDALNHKLRLITGLKRKEDLDAVREGELGRLDCRYLKQRAVYSNLDHAFYLNTDKRIGEIINNTELKLGDLADCVTGIYVGDNKKFIKVKSSNVRNSRGYKVVQESEIDHDYIGRPSLLDGLPGAKVYIPIVKGSSTSRYLRKDYPWFVDWGVHAINSYTTNKKARFQNSQFYFRKGIAVPMVKASNIRATLISGMVFDQSIVGVFPKDDNDILFLLGLLNSDIIRDIITTINPSANNSANYIRKIPVVFPDEETFHEINGKVGDILGFMKLGDESSALNTHKELNNIFNDLYLGL